MSEDRRIDVAGLVGPVWMIGWMFTIGFAHLAVQKALLAIVLWPYYLGVRLGQ
jgi:hypothetical protein